MLGNALIRMEGLRLQAPAIALVRDRPHGNALIRKEGLRLFFVVAEAGLDVETYLGYALIKKEGLRLGHRTEGADEGERLPSDTP